MMLNISLTFRGTVAEKHVKFFKYWLPASVQVHCFMLYMISYGHETAIPNHCAIRMIF